MKLKVIFTIFSLLSFTILSAIVPSTSIDTDFYQRLTTQFQGDQKSLDVVNDANDNLLRLATTGSYTGQFWRLHDVGGGYYRLTCQFQGTMKSLTVLSAKIPAGLTFKNGKIVTKFQKIYILLLTLSQDTSGQKWKMESLGGDWYRLTN